MQLDADEDGEPFFKPQAITPAPIRPRDEQPEQRQGEPGPGVESEQGTAATARAELEE